MSELIDLVDGQGEIVHRGVVRDDAEQYEGLHMQIVIAVIMNGLGHVLVHERAKTKRVNPGDIDLVCGGILSGETPEDAARREIREEAGIDAADLEVVRRGVNSYGRYCYLVFGRSDEAPRIDLDPGEVAWTGFMPLDELHAKKESGDFTFVDGFFEDIEQALAYHRVL